MMFTTESREQANGAAWAQPCYGACGEESRHAHRVLPWVEDSMCDSNPLPNREVGYWCATAVLQALQGQVMSWTRAALDRSFAQWKKRSSKPHCRPASPRAGLHHPTAQQRLPPRYREHPSQGPTALALPGRGEQDLTLPAICLEKDSTSASTP